MKIGDASRAAALVKGTEEAVGGVVVACYGVSIVEVIRAVGVHCPPIEGVGHPCSASAMTQPGAGNAPAERRAKMTKS